MLSNNKPSRPILGNLWRCMFLAQVYESCTPFCLNSSFYGCTHEKTCSISFYQFPVLSSICWEKSCGFSVKILFDCWRYTPSLPCIRYKWENYIDFSTKLSLTNRGNIYPEQSVHHPVSTLTVGNEEYPWSFQNKLVCSSFKWVSKYILFLPKLKGERVISWSKQGE